MSDSSESSSSSNKVTFLDQSMVSEYHVGEIVIAQNATYFDELNGAYAEITKELHWGTPLDLHSMEPIEATLGYSIDVFGPTDLQIFATPNQLRKLKGDEGELRLEPAESEKPEVVEV